MNSHKELLEQIESLKRDIVRQETNHENAIRILRKEFEVSNQLEANELIKKIKNEYERKRRAFETAYVKFNKEFKHFLDSNQ